MGVGLDFAQGGDGKVIFPAAGAKGRESLVQLQRFLGLDVNGFEIYERTDERRGERDERIIHIWVEGWDVQTRRVGKAGREMYWLYQTVLGAEGWCGGGAVVSKEGKVRDDLVIDVQHVDEPSW